MTARERILAIRLLEKQEQHPEYASRIGIQVEIVKKDSEENIGGIFSENMPYASNPLYSSSGVISAMKSE